jgi:lipopolysaccharide/colanic/teichoic acid biosynthesis glycosyltransferase
MSLESQPRVSSSDGADGFDAFDGSPTLSSTRLPPVPSSARGGRRPPLIGADGRYASGEDMVRRAVNRAFDIAIALTALILFLPVLLLLIAALMLTSGGPVIFAHHRVGRRGEMFPCLKFRTMHVDSDRILSELLASSAEARAEWGKDFKLRNDPRITPLGGILRKLSLDELPQLVNVLVGHMSVVGPRPIVPAEIERYGAFFVDYCSVRPGLTGLWQVSGRNDVSYAERVQMDVSYARAKSVLFDSWIIARTVPAVVAARGCY